MPSFYKNVRLIKFFPKEKACCVFLLAEYELVITAQRAFRREFNKDPPHENTTSRWFHQFEVAGGVEDRKGKMKTSVETVED